MVYSLDFKLSVVGVKINYMINKELLNQFLKCTLGGTNLRPGLGGTSFSRLSSLGLSGTSLSLGASLALVLP